MKAFSIVTSCYNEEGSIPELIRRVREMMGKLPDYNYEHNLIDNCTTDQTLTVLKQFTTEDRRIDVIVFCGRANSIERG